MRLSLRFLCLSACSFLLLAGSCQPKAKPGETDQTPANTETATNTFTAITNVGSGPGGALTSIAFGSCSRQDKAQVLWPAITAKNPDLFIWGGDNIYGDTQDMAVMAAKYKIQKENADYQALLATTKVIGTWDDHDYGVNDGGKFYPKKAESKALFMEFLDIPETNPITQHEGVYQAYTYGSKEQLVKVILLDTRTFRDTLAPGTVGEYRYEPNNEGDILGEAQWEWLEKELRNSPAQINLIVSSIQILADKQYFEKWMNFPAAHKRLMDLLTNVQPKGVILMSGDRHVGDIMKMDLPGLDYPLWEVTSSGLTHTWSRRFDDPNTYRVIEGVVMELNYGLMRFDWQPNGVNVQVDIKGLQDTTYASFSQQYKL